MAQDLTTADQNSAWRIQTCSHMSILSCVTVSVDSALSDVKRVSCDLADFLCWLFSVWRFRFRVAYGSGKI